MHVLNIASDHGEAIRAASSDENARGKERLRGEREMARDLVNVTSDIEDISEILS